MMCLAMSANPTSIVEANALFNASLDWDDNSDLDKAKDYRKSLRFLAAQRPEEFHKAAQGGVDVARFNASFLGRELDRVNIFLSLAADASNGGVCHGIDGQDFYGRH